MGQRKTKRFFTRIPVRVRGLDLLGKAFSEDTATVEINRDGARIGLKNIPRFGSQLEITNPATNLTASFSVTHQCPQSYSGLPEWGVEFSDPKPDFWGIAFEETKEEEEPVVSALLACTTCGRREMVNLSPDEYKGLGEAFFLPRQCSACNKVRNWEVVASEEEESADSSVAPAGEIPRAATGAERRLVRRLTLKAPILATGPTGAAELTETQDLSKTGLSFPCSLELEVGDRVQISVGHGVADNPSVRICRVMWRKPREKSVRYLYGVQFLSNE